MRRMLAGKKDVEKNAKGIDIRSAVCLRKAVLFRGGVTDGAQNLRIFRIVWLEQPRGVKIDQDCLISKKNNVFRLNVSVNCAETVQDPERGAELSEDMSCARRGEGAGFQYECQCITLNIFFQHHHVTVLFRNFQYLRQMRTVNVKKTMINISTALECATDITGAGLIVAKQSDLTPFALLQQPYLCVILL